MSAPRRDYYEVLGVAKDADPAEIKRCYRQAALKYHPDRNAGNAEAADKFKEAAEAYEVLSDENKRAAYDRFGHRGLEGVGHQGFGGVDDVFSHFGSIFEEFFGQRGGGGGRPDGPRRGDDLLYDLEVEFLEAALGSKRSIEFDQLEECVECRGTGAPPNGLKTCNQCNGRGQVVRGGGMFMISSQCGRCGGTGKMIVEPCKRCAGAGRERIRRKLAVTIPAGVDGRTRLRLSGEGEPGGRGGPPGDLYVRIHVKPHETFERDGYDVHFRHAVPFWDACLGGRATVPTLEGTEEVAVPRGAQHGDTSRLIGRGVVEPGRGGARGDLIVHWAITIPRKLTVTQEDLLLKFAAESTPASAPGAAASGAAPQHPPAPPPPPPPGKGKASEAPPGKKKKRGLFGL